MSQCKHSLAQHYKATTESPTQFLEGFGFQWPIAHSLTYLIKLNSQIINCFLLVFKDISQRKKRPQVTNSE
jgi:hypothetical protein